MSGHDQMCAEIDRLQAARAGDQQRLFHLERVLADLSWRPIDNVPKDGSPFLASWGWDEPLVCRWLPNEVGCFYYDPYGGELKRPKDQPRWWMPLPTTPKDVPRG